MGKEPKGKRGWGSWQLTIQALSHYELGLHMSSTKSCVTLGKITQPEFCGNKAAFLKGLWEADQECVGETLSTWPMRGSISQCSRCGTGPARTLHLRGEPGASSCRPCIQGATVAVPANWTVTAATTTPSPLVLLICVASCRCKVLAGCI